MTGSGSPIGCDELVPSMWTESPALKLLEIEAIRGSESVVLEAQRAYHPVPHVFLEDQVVEVPTGLQANSGDDPDERG